MVDRLTRPLRPCPILLICCLIVGGGGSIDGARPASGSDLRKTAIVKAVERVRASVVNIKGEKTIPSANNQASRVEPSRRVNGMGTGVVIDSRGYIVTNHHVVDGVREIQVTTADGEHFIARLMARDPETDLAVIKIDSPKPLPVIDIGTSADLMPGESVIAVGNAYGYEHTVTRGIVSALHRAVQVSDAQYYEDLIQTDASINPGNSGGPLLNIDGEMIGINVAVRAGAQGIGFAIPVDKAIGVASELLAACGARNTWHGMGIVNDTKARNAIVVESVEKQSPADQVGLQPGDTITAVGETTVERPLDFHRELLDRKAGEQVKLSVKRGGDSLALNLTLAAPPTISATPQMVAKTTSSPMWDLLGLELRPIPPEEFRQLYQTRYRGGLTVLDVRPQSAAAAQGIRRGDVLVGMHLWETISLENVTYIVNRPDFATLNPVKFFILRGNETLYGFLPVAMKTTPSQQR